MLMKLIIKLFGKNIIENAIAKTKLSKTKVIAIVAGAIFIIEKVLPAFGVVVVIPPDVYTLLASLGLWTLSDKLDSTPIQTPPPPPPAL